MIYLLIILSLFLHVWSDFYKQGWLAQSKCKKWWLEQKEATVVNLKGTREIIPLYINDYWGMLGAHSVHWTFCVMLPSIIYGIFHTHNIETFGLIALIMFIVNTVIHSFIDNLKANAMRINLLQDQLFHLIQIILTVLFLYCIS